MGKAHQGRAFENLIEAANRQYDILGLALIEKTEVQKKLIKDELRYTKKGAPDFMGIGPGGQAVVFDAKSTEANALPLKTIVRRIHQYEFLTKTEKLGGKAFYLVEFAKAHRVFILPLDQLNAAIKRHQEGGRASIPIEEFTIEVGSSFKVCLDYLQLFNREPGETARKKG